MRKPNARHVHVHHSLVSDTWRTDVETLEREIRKFAVLAGPNNDCRVSLFEMAGDPALHVNVTHRHQTQAPSGWAGPAVLPQGFVHNRTFGDMKPTQIVRHIREMVYSDRI